MVLAPQDCGCPIIEEGPSLVNSPVCPGNFLFMILLEQYLWGRCDISTPCKRIESVDQPKEAYDFIVVGAGAAGSIVAGRLSEDSNSDVLLIEGGGQSPLGVRIPSFYRTFWGNEDVDWGVRTVPADYCLDQGGKGCQWPLGKGLGGTSQLNGMMYHRGHPADYDDWVALGAEGWSWDEIKPFMDMAEGNKQVGTLVSGEYHSDSGKMPIQTFAHQPGPINDMKQAVKEAGRPLIQDMNNPNTPEGFCVAQAFNADGQRYTTARAYLEPKSVRPNLDVKLNSVVTRVLFDGDRAYGVEYIDENCIKRTVNATKEVILSAGALNSPKILMYSGVGPREVLEPLGIPVLEDLPVGKTLKNHCGATLYFLLTAVNNTEALDWNALTDYLLKREGPMSSTGITQFTGLLYSSYANRSLLQPDLQFFFNGLYAECSKTGVIGEKAGDCPNAGYNVSANAVALLPRSVGWMTINSSDPTDPALYFPNFFSHPDDMAMIKEGLLHLRDIFYTETLQEKYKIVLDPTQLGDCEELDAWSDEWLECIIRYHTDPQNHQLGTAAMGLVTNPQLQVLNLRGIRVCDAAAMPSQPTGNPQGAIMGVAERCAHFLKEAWK
uniref:Glucose oxidase n=1 Tax=Mythimna separata TaxID=271217 RepID=A0A218N0E8_MYTSE|nr:glucose oxidase [Mythimna separata]